MRQEITAAFVLAAACACSFEAPSSASRLDQVEEPAGWPLEIGDTIDLDTWRELVARFESVGKWGFGPTETVLERHGAEIRASDHGLAAFDATLAKVQKRRRQRWPPAYACPPAGLVVKPGDEFETTDGAIIVEPESWPPGLPCDEKARYRPVMVYRGHVK